MKITGFYIIKNEYFDFVEDPFLKTNKNGMRPHYYCFKDANEDIYWMIPLSSKIHKYRKIIDKRTSEGKQCDILHIAKLDDGKESVFLIQDMFPIKKEYIEREYTICNNHLMLTSENTCKIINKKAHKILKCIKNGVKLNPTQPNVLLILDKITNNNNHDRSKYESD